MDDENVNEVVRKIIEVNQTGHPGDGKIFVSSISEAYRIRTGESGEATVNKEMVDMGAEINSEIGDKQQLVENMMKALPEKAARNRRNT